MLVALRSSAAQPPPWRHPTPRSAPRPSGSRRPWSRCAGSCTQQPELSNREEHTGRFVAERLRALGIEVRYPVAKTGVVGVLRGGRPGGVVALRADMDALPIEETNDLPFRSQVEGRDARLRARRAHGDPARRGGGARGPAGAASRHRRVPVPARRGGRARGRGGRRAADGEGRSARRPEGAGGLRAPRRRLDRARARRAGATGRSTPRPTPSRSRSRARPCTAPSRTWASTRSRSRPSW